jgi:hypothetical protein
MIMNKPFSLVREDQHAQPAFLTNSGNSSAPTTPDTISIPFPEGLWLVRRFSGLYGVDFSHLYGVDFSTSADSCFCSVAPAFAQLAA